MNILYKIIRLCCIFWLVTGLAKAADNIENRVAVMTGIDKVTGRVYNFDIYVDETVQFGALQITPKVCHTKPQTEIQQTKAFLQIYEIPLSGKVKQIFSGWMFADSPGLNGLEHAVYDVWLIDCKMTSDVPPPFPGE